MIQRLVLKRAPKICGCYLDQFSSSPTSILLQWQITFKASTNLIFKIGPPLISLLLVDSVIDYISTPRLCSPLSME